MIIAGEAAFMVAGTNPAKLISTFGGTSYKPSDYSAINNDGILILKAYSAGLTIGDPTYNAATQNDGGNYFAAHVVRGLVGLNTIKGMGGSGSYNVSGFQRHPRHVGLMFFTDIDPASLSDGPGFTISGVTFDPTMHIYQDPGGGNFSKQIIPCYKADAYKSGTIIHVDAPTGYSSSITLIELLGA